MDQPSYSALYSRMARSVIRLGGLGEDDRIELLKRVRDMYSKAYLWDARRYVDDSIIERLVHTLPEHDTNIRNMLQKFILLLEEIRENPGIDLSELDLTENGY